MKIVKNRLEYLDPLVELVEEYREFCGSNPKPDRTRAFFEKLLTRNGAVTFIAIDEINDNLMGFVNLYPSYSTLSLKRIWILNDLAVARNYRGLGVAKALIHEAVLLAKSTGAVRIELKTQKTNINAQKLYNSLDFDVDEAHVHYSIPV